MGTVHPCRGGSKDAAAAGASASHASGSASSARGTARLAGGRARLGGRLRFSAASFQLKGANVLILVETGSEGSNCLGLTCSNEEEVLGGWQADRLKFAYSVGS